MMIAKFFRNFASRKCEGNTGKSVERDESLCDDVEAVRSLYSYVTG